MATDLLRILSTENKEFAMVVKEEKDTPVIAVCEPCEYGSSIAGIVQQLVDNNNENNFAHESSAPIPSRDAIINMIRQYQQILLPGYFIQDKLDKNIQNYLEQEMISLFDELSHQIALCLKRDYIRNGLSYTHCDEQSREEAIRFLRKLPALKMLLIKDVQAAYEGDPAASSHDEIILCYPGLLAVTVYRIAHQLYLQNIPLMPRIISEYVHGLTGIDIHPGADIGESFFIDHGVGVVIGATSDIGDRVRIYQGVTLGALALSKEAVEKLRSAKRHPTIGDDVIIYAGATILGGNTVIGAKSVIGGNVWLTESVPPNTRVFIKKPELILKGAG
jgi:serine O-acetyltransferase